MAQTTKLFLLALLASCGAAEESCAGGDDEAACPQKGQIALQMKTKTFEKLHDEEQLSFTIPVTSTTRGQSEKAKVVVQPGSDAATKGSGIWVITVAAGCTNADIARMAEHMPKGSKAKFMGHPDEGGLCTFMMEGTKEMVVEELKSHEWSSEVTVESSAPLEIVPEEDGEATRASLAEEEVGIWEEWNLDRIDSRSGEDGTYSPPANGNQGAGVHIYVFDTGIRTTHGDFEGRAVPLLDQFQDEGKKHCAKTDTSCAADLNGHGTHCASIAAGRRYGVAKKAQLYSVKIFDKSGRGDFHLWVESLDWVLAHGPKPAVASMSFGAPGRYRALEISINKAVMEGLNVVVASGNHGQDACSITPANIHSAVTVGATQQGDVGWDKSNWGSCVDIWAPGVNIEAASHKSDSLHASTWKSGTSMACPHVAGAMALLYNRYPHVHQRELASKLLYGATHNKLSGLKSSDHNRFLYLNSPMEYHFDP